MEVRQSNLIWEKARSEGPSVECKGELVFSSTVAGLGETKTVAEMLSTFIAKNSENTPLD